MKKKFQKSTIKKVLSYIKKYRFLLIFSLLLALLTVGATLYIPIIVGDAIDLIVGKNDVDFDGIFTLLLRAVIIAVATSLLQWIMNNINNVITYNVIRDVRNDAFSKIEKLPLKYIDSHSYGETVSRVIADADQFADGLLMGFTQFFTGVMTIAGTLAFMLAINAKITLVVVILTPLSLIIASFIAKNTYNMFHIQSETRAEETAVVDETISNLKVVKAFSHEEKSIADFDEVNERLKKCSVKAVFFSSLVNPSTRFINALVYSGVALAGAFAALGTGGDAITIGALFCFLNYANQYAKPFNEISGVVTELQNAIACASRIFELTDEEPETPDAPNAHILCEADGNVTLDDVSFSYVPERKLIEHLSLDVKPGMRIAIVGPTGCGKTTLINLLMRFYDVCAGSISVDGYNINEVTRHSLRKNYGMVLQETWIKSGTVRENIAMGKPNATDEEIIEAAKASHAHGFIKRLPNGYDTFISEEENSLSQGQKQLLCISRVMLCLPPMLILDEATSSIDTRTEAKIQEAFARLMKGRTSFIVAHRLSTIREADLILVMKDGKVIEKGNHEQLLKNNGFYSVLYNSQFENREDLS